MSCWRSTMTARWPRSSARPRKYARERHQRHGQDATSIRPTARTSERRCRCSSCTVAYVNFKPQLGFTIEVGKLQDVKAKNVPPEAFGANSTSRIAAVQTDVEKSAALF